MISIEKITLPLILILTVGSQLSGQELQLERAFELYERNLESIQKSGIYEAIKNKKDEAIKAGRLPDISFKVDGRIQSESTSFDIENLPFQVDLDIPLYNARGFLEARYTVIDGGLTDLMHQQNNLDFDRQMLNVELLKQESKQPILDLFLGITELRQQSDLLDLTIDNLRSRENAIRAGVEEGAILESELDKLALRRLELESNKSGLRNSISGLLQTLSYLMDTTLSQDVELVLPSVDPEVRTIKRVELDQLDHTKRLLDFQSAMIRSERRPKLSAFVQGGVGHPNPLNPLDNQTSTYALAGVQFIWPLVDWKSAAYKREALTLQASETELKREDFLLGIEASRQKFASDVQMIQDALTYDEEIIRIQTRIAKTAEAQLDEGIITSTEYLEQVNKELAARQQKLLHETQLIKIYLNQANILGGL